MFHDNTKPQEDVTFEFLGKVTTEPTSPFLLCFSCGLSIPSGKTAYCYMGGDSPLYAYLCETCMDIFSFKQDPDVKPSDTIL
ncbi:MAG: hypothetical protein XD84_0158 [Desulfotomaculum sp. 46_80]|nr:MAG: hypothetical protein XD84_0158 [Desulfotomaculum sp. 46_80]HAG08896.1 hypothetical protein [Desulfotomaculum sp.]HAU32731.1 hypothetical protein [Desulfotomaculum sp.]